MLLLFSGLLRYPLQGGLHCLSDPPCPGNVSFAGYVSLSAPSPCERPYRLRVLWADLTPWQPSASLLLLGRGSLPGCFLGLMLGSGLPQFRGFPVCGSLSVSLAPAPVQELPGSPKFLSFLSTHATLLVDPGRPSESSPKRPLCVGFWHR